MAIAALVLYVAVTRTDIQPVGLDHEADEDLQGTART
ncbi:hypothetical protein ABIB25_000295 [Nakamurella sp. UYEF19]